jgi:hypothetical protein
MRRTVVVLALLVGCGQGGPETRGATGLVAVVTDGDDLFIYTDE